MAPIYAYRIQSQVDGQWRDFGPACLSLMAYESSKRSLVGSGWRVLRSIGTVAVWQVYEAW